MNAISRAANKAVSPSIFMLQTILAAPDDGGGGGGDTVPEGVVGEVLGVVEPDVGGGGDGVVGGLPVGPDVDALTLI